MRINIHYVLPKETEEECLKINRMICEHIPKCEINFQLKIYKPHITLFMGEIKDNLFNKHFKQIEKYLKSLHFSAIDKEIEFTPIFFKNNFIMSDVKNSLNFVEDSKLLIQGGVLEECLVVPHKYQIANGTATPHITLGYCNQIDLPKNFLESLPKIRTTVVKSIECSPAGKHGTVLIKR